MKKSTFVTLFVLLITAALSVSAQYNSPEAIAVDPATGNYYIANSANGTITRRDAAGTTSVFIAQGLGLVSPKGLFIDGNVIYVTDQTTVKGYDTFSAMNVFNVTVPNTTALHDITGDHNSYLYVSDPTANKIFQVYIPNQVSHAFASAGLNQPTGLFYDSDSSRVMVVEFATTGAKIKAIKTSDLVVNTIVSTTSNKLDGITRDNDKNWYVTSYQGNKIVRYAPDFSGTPVGITASGTLSSPSGITVNTSVMPNEIAVTSKGNNQVYFFPIPVVGIEKTLNSNNLQFSVGGNELNIRYYQNQSGWVKLELLDITGKQVKLILNGNEDAGNHDINTHLQVTPGIYMLRLTTRDGALAKKLVF